MLTVSLEKFAAKQLVKIFLGLVAEVTVQLCEKLPEAGAACYRKQRIQPPFTGKSLFKSLWIKASQNTRQRRTQTCHEADFVRPKVIVSITHRLFGRHEARRRRPEKMAQRTLYVRRKLQRIVLLARDHRDIGTQLLLDGRACIEQRECPARGFAQETAQPMHQIGIDHTQVNLGGL